MGLRGRPADLANRVGGPRRLNEYAETTWAKWVNWLDTIRSEIYDLHHHREIWRTLVDLIAAQQLEDSEYFVDAFTRMYVAGQAMGLRRQADNDKNAVSLARLLQGLATDHALVTRERFLALWELDEIDTSHERGAMKRSFLEERAGDTWATFAGDARGPYLDRNLPDDDRKHLEDVAREVVDFATRTIAHTDKRGGETLPTIAMLHQSIEARPLRSPC